MHLICDTAGTLIGARISQFAQDQAPEMASCLVLKASAVRLASRCTQLPNQGRLNREDIEACVRSTDEPFSERANGIRDIQHAFELQFLRLPPASGEFVQMVPAGKGPFAPVAQQVTFVQIPKATRNVEVILDPQRILYLLESVSTITLSPLTPKLISAMNDSFGIA